METKVNDILKATELLIRTGGYNSFSFRDVATAVGIKSSSVHYHFPTKEDLAAAVANQYSDRFINSLGSPAELSKSGKNSIDVYIKAFRTALVSDKKMCLCGLLGAEKGGLPEKVVAATQDFFKRNLLWLEEVYCQTLTKAQSKQKAIQTLSLLEGALITSNVMGDIKIFDQAAKQLQQ